MNASTGIGRILRLWFGVRAPVKRRAYLCSGVSLAVFKYATEALVLWLVNRQTFMPWDFLNPAISPRIDLVKGAPDWLPWIWFLWSLPFLWIAVTMSVRRAADAGYSPWYGLVVLIPVINLFWMATLCQAPSSSAARWSVAPRATSSFDSARRGAFAVAISLMIGGVMLWVSVYLLHTYGASLFLGTPFLMSSTAAFLYNRPYPRSFIASAGIGLACVLFASLALLLFALEGVFCIVMAAPLMLPIGALGGVMGKAIADATQRPARDVLAGMLMLPLLAGVESMLATSHEFEVVSAVEVAAPPSVVWRNVIGFPEIASPKPWYFAWGIACPERATIDGQGVGAVRRCEFTTGTFVEPVTAWEAPTRLAFDVAEQPEPMFELSPYHDVHPPHLNHYLRSTRGEFRLVALAGGGTRLEGRTWYRFDMFPQWYWMLWSDAIIHRIHLRVLEHIRIEAEKVAADESIAAVP